MTAVRPPTVHAAVYADGAAEVSIDGVAYPTGGASEAAGRENVVRFIASRVAAPIGRSVIVQIDDPAGHWQVEIYPDGTLAVLSSARPSADAAPPAPTLEPAPQPAPVVRPSPSAPPVAAASPAPAPAPAPTGQPMAAVRPESVVTPPTPPVAAEVGRAEHEPVAADTPADDEAPETALDTHWEPDPIHHVPLPAPGTAWSQAPPPAPIWQPPVQVLPDAGPALVTPLAFQAPPQPLAPADHTAGAPADAPPAVPAAHSPGQTPHASADPGPAAPPPVDPYLPRSPAPTTTGSGHPPVGRPVPPADPLPWIRPASESGSGTPRPAPTTRSPWEPPPVDGSTLQPPGTTAGAGFSAGPGASPPSPQPASAPAVPRQAEPPWTPPTRSPGGPQQPWPPPGMAAWALPHQPVDAAADPASAAPGGAVQGVGPSPQLPLIEALPAPAPTLDSLLAARQQPASGPATTGWRGVMRTITGGLIALRPGPVEQAERADTAAVQRVLAGPRTIVVVNPKGGAHKTTATLLLAATLGSHRGGYTLAWDNNETRGTMGWRSRSTGHSRTAVDLLHDLDRFAGTRDVRAGDLDGYVRSQGGDRFDVLASDEDAASAASIDRDAFLALHRSLSRFYRLIVVDTGNNMRAGNWQAAVDKADQLVIVSTVREDTGQSAAWMVDALRAAGRHDTVRNAVTIFTAAAKEVDPGLTDRLHQHFGQITRAVVDVPYDPALTAGGPVDTAALSVESRRAWLHAAAVIVDGL